MGVQYSLLYLDFIIIFFLDKRHRKIILQLASYIVGRQLVISIVRIVVSVVQLASYISCVRWVWHYSATKKIIFGIEVLVRNEQLMLLHVI